MNSYPSWGPAHNARVRRCYRNQTRFFNARFANGGWMLVHGRPVHVSVLSTVDLNTVFG